MDFGTWVQAMRHQREMDVRAFAQVVGVDASTISRLEQARSHVTLCTAVRICEGLAVTPADLLSVLQGKRSTLAGKHHLIDMPEVVTREDLETFLSTLRRHWQEGCLWLTTLLKRIEAHSDPRASAGDEASSLMVPEDIEKLLQGSRWYHFKLHYPEDMKAEAIWNIYLHGGALTLVDIGMYIRQVRRTRRVTLSGLEESGTVSASVLSRLETGALECVKLTDVVTLDEQLGQEGKIVAMYWQACILMDTVAHQHQRDERADVPMPAAMDRREQDMKVIELFLTICRWLSCLYPSDHSWMDEFRGYRIKA